MRVVIAGSSGLIGTALVAELRHAGHTVTRLVRRQPVGDDERRWDPPAGFVEQDALAGVDAVVNLCGADVARRRWTEERKQVLKDSRHTPTEVLAGAVAEHGVGTLVNASAVGFYGNAGDTTLDETSPAGTGFLARLCQDWERATEPAAPARVVLLRTGLVLAGHGGLVAWIRPLFTLYAGGRLGSGRQFMSWVSLDDVTAAIRFALEHDTLAGPVNVTAPMPVTNAEFTRTLATALHRPAPWTVPAFALRLVFGELADEGILASQRAVPAALSRAGFQFRHESLRDALTGVL
ncbi:MAG TPA: TIGR01777 family oxidoreductase [Pseudonocardiaceae bacterium]|nr:TIGR01777 family oxidoreductase [Pseudonocardiaceae bacterium]